MIHEKIKRIEANRLRNSVTSSRNRRDTPTQPSPRKYQPSRLPYARCLVPGGRHDGAVDEGRHRSHVRGVTEQHATQFVRWLVHAGTTRSSRLTLEPEHSKTRRSCATTPPCTLRINTVSRAP